MKETEMIMFRNVASLIGGAAVLAAAVGLTAGLAPATATPTQTPGANLYIHPDPEAPGFWELGIEGVFAMSEHDAHGFINNINTGERPGGIEYNVTGDDDSNDTGLFGAWYPGAGWDSGGGLYAAPDGIRFTRSISIVKSTLDEDHPGVFDNDLDEIYVHVRFVDADGGVRRVYTNKVEGNFG
jgi:hypothetical protein